MKKKSFMCKVLGIVFLITVLTACQVSNNGLKSSTKVDNSSIQEDSEHTELTYGDLINPNRKNGHVKVNGGKIDLGSRKVSDDGTISYRLILDEETPEGEESQNPISELTPSDYILISSGDSSILYEIRDLSITEVVQGSIGPNGGLIRTSEGVLFQKIRLADIPEELYDEVVLFPQP